MFENLSIFQFTHRGKYPSGTKQLQRGMKLIKVDDSTKDYKLVQEGSSMNSSDYFARMGSCRYQIKI